MNAVIDVGFDYSVIDADGRDDVKEAAVRIRLRMSHAVEDIIEIGRDLTAVKCAIGHGNFLRWIEAEFAMSVSTAQNLMNVAARFGDKFPTVGNLAPSILYALATKSTPDEVIEEVIERAANGETVTKDDVAELKAKCKELKRQVEEQKLKAKDALASQNDFGRQLQELRSDLTGLRDERDTLRHELDRAKRGMVGDTKIVAPVADTDAIEMQIATIMSAWNKAGPEAREEFLRRIDTPVMDTNFGEAA